MKVLLSLFLLAACWFPAISQTTSSPRATATGGYIAAASDVYSIDWNMAATALGTAKIEAAFGIFERTVFFDGGFDNFYLLLRPAARHAAAIFRTGAYGTDHLVFPRRLFTISRDERTPLDYGHTLFHEWGWGLGYAYQMRPQTALGLDVRQQVYSNTFTSNEFWSLSLSIAHRPRKWLSLGAAFRNLINYNYDKPEHSLTYLTPNGETKTAGISLTTYQNIRVTPERRLEAGVALKPVEELLLTLDLFSNFDYATGFEWQAAGWLALRMSVGNKHDQLLQRDRFYQERRVFGWAWGTGMKIKSLDLDFTYYKPYSEGDSIPDSPSTGMVSIIPRRDDQVMLALSLAL